MQGVTNINYVSKDAANILLIANNSNHVHSGIHLKFFKNTHNIYVIFHDFKEDGDRHSFYYKDLTTYHKQIVEELDKHNLYKFTISALSFGCYLAYYMMFYLPERVEKAFIFDYHWNSTQRIVNNRITANNWIIPKTCAIPVIVYISRKNPDWSTSEAFITPLESISLLQKFRNIRFLFSFSHHDLQYDNGKKRISTFILNGFSNKYFWRVLYSKWMNNQKTCRHKVPKIIVLLLYLIIRKL